MIVSLEILYTNIVAKLEEERTKISDDDFEKQSFRCASYVILLHSSVEFFTSRALERIINVKMRDCDAKNKLIGDFSNNKINFELHLSLLLPECYIKSEIWDKMTKQRNRYAHASLFRNKDGQYKLVDEPIIEKQLDDYLDYSKKLMNKLLEY